MRRPTMRLKSADLPTFGRPTMAMSPLDIADRNRLLERSERVRPLGYELLAHKAFVAGRYDRAHYRGIIDLLCLIDLVAARDPAGMIMADMFGVVLDRADHIPLHDLHVVDIV